MSETVKINGKKIEFAKWLVIAWFTLTMILLGFAVSWGINIATVNNLEKYVEQHEKILRGTGTEENPGMISDIRVIKNDLKWVRGTLGKIENSFNDRLIKVGVNSEKNK